MVSHAAVCIEPLLKDRAEVIGYASSPNRSESLPAVGVSLTGVVLTPCTPRSRSWPDFSQSVVELLHSEPEMIQKSEKRATHEHILPAWDDCLGLSPGHDLWAGVTNLMICNLPAR